MFGLLFNNNFNNNVNFNNDFNCANDNDNVRALHL
tara:strand:- start:2437 stop:2541 length:105 start_codon:yes stop_codon:yes gene_type:complete